MALAVADWSEGNPRLARRETERALRSLLEGKLGSAEEDGEGGSRPRRQGRSSEGGAGGVPVPLGVCVAATGMLLVTSIAESGSSR